MELIVAKPIEQRRCHVCGQSSRQRVVRPYEYQVSHDGRPPVTIRVPDLEVIACTNPACRPEHPDDTTILDDAAAGRLTVETYRQLGLLTPEEIREKRTALGLTQQEMQDAMGLGGNSLSRWESGAVYQSRAMDRFLRVYFASADARRKLAESASPTIPA